MTFALCLQCASAKEAILIVCKHCGFAPKSDQEKARAWIYSPYGMTAEGLAQHAHANAGNPLPQPPADLEKKWIDHIKQQGESDGWLDLNPHIYKGA